MAREKNWREAGRGSGSGRRKDMNGSEPMLRSNSEFEQCRDR